MEPNPWIENDIVIIYLEDREEKRIFLNIGLDKNKLKDIDYFLQAINTAEAAVSMWRRNRDPEKLTWSFTHLPYLSKEDSANGSNTFRSYWALSHLVFAFDKIYNQAFELLYQKIAIEPCSFRKISNLFYEPINCCDREDSFWLLPDGSLIGCDFAAHRQVAEEYLYLKESEIEREWVKVSHFRVYTHKNMTDAQWKTIDHLIRKRQNEGKGENYSECRDLWENEN